MNFHYSIDGDKIPDGHVYNVDGDLVPAEPDYNWPKPPTIATHVDLDNSDALYIYVPRGDMPPNKFHQYIERVAKEFRAAFPGRTILVGGDDLKFTTISKKQEFVGRLDGTIGELEE